MCIHILTFCYFVFQTSYMLDVWMLLDMTIPVTYSSLSIRISKLPTEYKVLAKVMS